MSKFATTLVVACLVLSCGSPPTDERSIEREIRAIMDRQTAEWNEGRIDGFMGYYWRSDRFTFQSGNRRLEGWEQLRAMYRRTYAGEKRGTLDFSEVEVNVLSRDAAYVLGRWRVVTADTTKAGLFTLIFRRIDGEWRITHDHSS
jgi:uncharacterized protein (TIGR02246 family)